MLMFKTLKNCSVAQIQSMGEIFAQAMIERGYESPYFSARILLDGERVNISINADIPIEHRISTDFPDSYTSLSEYYDDDDPNWAQDFLDKINEKETPQAASIRKFQLQLGNLIDKARNLGIEDEIVNPLAELSKKLSENAITHTKTPAS